MCALTLPPARGNRPGDAARPDMVKVHAHPSVEVPSLRAVTLFPEIRPAQMLVSVPPRLFRAWRVAEKAPLAMVTWNEVESGGAPVTVFGPQRISNTHWPS